MSPGHGEDAREKRVLVPPVARELNALDSRRAPVQILDDRPSSIARTVVHESDVTVRRDHPRFDHFLEQRFQLARGLGKHLFFVIAGDDDAQRRRTAAGCSHLFGLS